jgi:poly(3-hydroxybutyrate) depolymerase
MRVHFIIDFVCAVLFAHWSFIVAEKLSYFGDVLVFGHDGKKRNLVFYKPCQKCGWGNIDKEKLMVENE